MSPVRDSTRDLELLSELLLCPTADDEGIGVGATREYQDCTLDAIFNLTHADLERLSSLAHSNHVVMRAFEPLQQVLARVGRVEEARWVTQALCHESARRDHALSCLQEICSALEDEGCPVTVIKSLDHWPDLGSDLDLYTGTDARRVVELMRRRFGATLAERSWGDWLANKWNFIVPDLPELVEVHAGRLGQTGEQTAVTVSLAARSRWADINGYTFRVAAPEDRLVISTLQRMYRHFYIRLCDIVDNARLLDRQLVDFEYLHTLASRAGLWDGVAAYLVIISEYVEAYRGKGVPLPSLVMQEARFGVGEITFRRQFLRVPILPHSMVLYAAELKNLLLNGEFRNSLRLSLMPGLATAAALEQRMTGSDKGIW
jgi:hypothetical protein